jgi:hypothetical protein
MIDMNGFFYVVFLIIRYEFMTIVIVWIHFIHLLRTYLTFSEPMYHPFRNYAAHINL